MRKDKKEFLLDAVSGIDEDVVERHLIKRYKLWNNRGKRIRVGMISMIAAVLCLAILGGVVLTMLPLGKQVPVYQGMTVSNQAPAVQQTEAALSVPHYSLLSTSSTLPAYGLSQLSEEDTLAAEQGTNDADAPVVFGKTYYAMKNEDIYIHIHIENPDGFEIVSFTLNGVKYTNYMFEPGSDLETLILKYNVGDVDGLQEYTIDAIKYIDGEDIKDVRMQGDKTVKVYVNDDTQALSLQAETVFNTLHFTPVWDESFTGEKTIQSLALYQGEELLRELSPTDTVIKDLPMGTRLVLVATYSDGETIQTLRYIFDTPKCSEGLQIVDGVIMGMGTCTDSVLYLNQPIGFRAFAENDIIREVYMGPGVTSVGGEAFSSCLGLQKAVFPDSAVELENGVFSSCENLIEVSLPEEMVKLQGFTFHNCSSLSSIGLPKKLEYIGESAFALCVSLKQIELPEGLTHIDASAFENCQSLEKIELPDSVTTLGASCFMSCTSLESIALPDSVTQMQGAEFAGCTALKHVKLPAYIEELPNALFRDCTSLEHVEIPDSVKVIQQSCFAGAALESISIPDGVEKIESYAFAECYHLQSIELSEGVEFVLSPNATELAGEAWFTHCSNLTEVTVRGKACRFDFSIFSKENDTSVNLSDVYYGGTMQEFKELFQGDAYLTEHRPTIHCTDGDFRFS